MEPISVSALIMLLAKSCIKLAIKLYANAKELKMVDDDVRFLGKDVESCLADLELLENHLRGPSNQTPDDRLGVLQKRLDDSRQTLESVKSELASLQIDGVPSPITLLGVDLKRQTADTLTKRLNIRLTDRFNLPAGQVATGRAGSYYETGEVSQIKSRQTEIDAESYVASEQQTIQKAALDLGRRDPASAQSSLLSLLIRLENPYGMNYEGSHKTMELLAMAYCQQSLWEEAENVMSILALENADGVPLEIMHNLAEVWLAKNELAKAENWCRRAMERTKKLGERHPLYYLSVRLRVDVLERRGFYSEAEIYQNLLPGHTFLDHVNRGDTKAIRFQLEHVTRNDLDAALIIAAHKGHEDIVDLLLKRGADVEKRERDKQPVLIIAARNGYAGIVKLLVQKGANVNVTDRFGETGLMLAASEGHEDVVRVLLDGGADHQARNSYHRTATYIAKRRGKQNIVNLIKARRRKRV